MPQTFSTKEVLFSTAVPLLSAALFVLSVVLSSTFVRMEGSVDLYLENFAKHEP